MNILGVDYGKKRIGLAWMNTDLDVILPFGTVKNLLELEDVIKKEKIEKIIFGLPFDHDGGENLNTKHIRNLANSIKEKFVLELDFFDESFTTGKAKKIAGDISLDEKSAMIILEDYFKK